MIMHSKYRLGLSSVLVATIGAAALLSIASLAGAQDAATKASQLESEMAMPGMTAGKQSFCENSVQIIEGRLVQEGAAPIPAKDLYSTCMSLPGEPSQNEIIQAVLNP
jgi:L-asparaginase II